MVDINSLAILNVADRVAKGFGLSLYELFTLLEEEMYELQGNESI